MKNLLKKTMSVAGTALMLAFVLCSATLAQEVTGSLVGTVKDINEAVVPNATVTITDPSKGNIVVRTINASDDGVFSAPNLPISVYTVTVEAANFKKSVQTDIKLDVGQRREINIILEAGNISEVITVEADQVAVELSTPTSSTTINGDQVRELSINNRNFTQLVTLAPGVSNDLADFVSAGTTTPETGTVNLVQISVNGARSSQNTFTVDGADVTDRGSNLTIQAYPSVDSIGEFKVLRSLYPAEAGRSGGGQVNVVTRSGTSEFHGSLYEFVRNERFNANDFFSNQTSPVGKDPESGKARRRPFRYNNFGYTIGGPIFFLGFGEGGPTVKRYDKTFFFFSQEFRRDIRYPALTSTVPDANLRKGIFTVPICLQASGTTCTSILTPGNKIPVINPVAQQYLDLIYNKLPLPNGATQFGLVASAKNISNFRQEILKIDHSFNEKLSMYYRFQNDRIPSIDANALFSSGSSLPEVSTTETNSPGRTHTLQTTYAASSNLIFEGRYTFGYGAILSKNIGLLALENTPITPPLAYANQRDRIPSISGNGFNGLVGFGPYDNFSWKGNITGTVTYIFGNHTAKAGAVYSKYRKNENALAGVNEGQFSGFNTPGVASALLAPGGSTVQQQFANFLLGTNVTFTQASFDYTADLRSKAFEAFGQDEWRIRPNLTLYYGVRYSFFGAPYDKNGRLSNFDPAFFNPAAAPAVTGAGNRIPGTGNFCNGIIVNSQNANVPFPNCSPTVSPYGKFVMDAPKNDFAPRVGLAFDPFGKGRTSIRTGYGIYHEQVLSGTALNQIGTNPPYQQNCVVSGVRLDNPVPNGCAVQAVNTVANIRAIQSDWNTPYMQQWSLDIQQQLTKDTLVTAGYYGSKGTHLIGSFELNLLPPGKAIASTCATGNTYIGGPTPTLAQCQVPGTAFFSSAAETILDQLRPNRGYRSIAMVQPRFNSNYHSLQLFGQHRFGGASQVNVAYTWSKNLTDSQNDRSAAPQNSFDIPAEKSRATLDRRHIFTTNFVYELPFFRESSGLLRAVLGGFQASGIYTYQTGLPFTATTSNYDPAGVGLIPPPTTVARPNVLCNPNEGGAGTQQQFFNTSCFQLNPLTTATGLTNLPGNASRGIIEGPPTNRFDLTLMKNIRFNESMRLQLRAEAFNLFNKTNFRALSTNVTAANFGQVISTRDPRNLQFAVKFYF
ncbi:MAG TPA: carboxypeptidase regulatory-like domain-containing protein [Pyrinomonadaceae bacterium]|jgi:hypothetical protein